MTYDKIAKRLSDVINMRMRNGRRCVAYRKQHIPGANEPVNYTVEQLKRWLSKCRGLKQAGKREDLLARVNNCLKGGINHHILNPSIDDGKWMEVKILKDRKGESLETSTKTMPDVPLILKTCWKAFPSQDLPLLFNYSHVYHYVLDLCPLCQGCKMTTKRTKTENLQAELDT